MEGTRERALSIAEGSAFGPFQAFRVSS